MHIQIVGINYKTAPIEIRENLSFSKEELTEALILLKRYKTIEENLILSTCNRTEIYTVVKDVRLGLKEIQSFIRSFHNIQKEEIDNYLYSFSDIDAVRHLFRVVSSLDSMVLGESQIFGQVKDAYFKARQYRTINNNLISVFEEAIKVGKKVRALTRIGQGAVSVSTVAVKLAKKIFENLEGKKVLIIGAGKIGELVVKNLFSKRAKTVLVANRTFEKACELAETFKGSAIKFNAIIENLIDTDILISSTSAPHFMLKKEEMELVMKQRSYRPLFLIDLGLPRNIDPKINELENIYLYNIDDLAKVRDANIKERLLEAKKAEHIIEKQIRKFAPRIKNCFYTPKTNDK